MREIRLSGSVEGVVSNHDPYSDCETKRARGPENTDLVTMRKRLGKEDEDNRRYSALLPTACQVENQ